MFRLAVLSIRFCDLVSVSRLLSLITQIIWKTHSGDTVLISLFSSFILSKTDVLESLHKRTVYQISRILSEPRNKGHFGYRASLFVKSNECKSHPAPFKDALDYSGKFTSRLKSAKNVKVITITFTIMFVLFF